MKLILELIRGHHYPSFGIRITASYFGNCIHLKFSTDVLVLINQQCLCLLS